jgi:hypothetical protein
MSRLYHCHRKAPLFPNEGTPEQKEAHRGLRARVRGAVEVNQNQCGQFGKPSQDCLELFKAGVERPCFDACYREFLANFKRGSQ